MTLSFAKSVEAAPPKPPAVPGASLPDILKLPELPWIAEKRAEKVEKKVETKEAAALPEVERPVVEGVRLKFA